MEKEYRVSEEFLDKVVDNNARNLVGMVMKRFEILSQPKDVKRAIKELIYENQRSLKALIKSFSSGVKFQVKPKSEDSE